jgi:dTDP-N-acetylfucosamine:lipid II N-acetylfucosaminyltransferase
MILHLIDDPKFAADAYDYFEEYFPGLNHFFMQISRHEKMPDKKKIASDRFFNKAFTDRTDIHFIKQYALKNEIKHILVHNLTPTKAAVANQINKHTGAKTYWIFYGADLYSRLNVMGKYVLLDEETHDQPKIKLGLKSRLAFWYLFRQHPISAFNKFISELNYFCFWNEYDFLLLKKHFNTRAEHKPFLYFRLIDRNYLDIIYKKDTAKVLVNHSASANGNHRTVLEKLKELKNSDNIREIIAPLSYGSEGIKLAVSEFGNKLFGERFISLVNFMPVNDYYAMLNKIPVAIFGNRRQEAGGNVFYLLGKGAKIFLRNDNNMITWLRDRGFRVFSFEDDLNSFYDLSPLSMEDMQINITIHTEFFSKENERKSMYNLIQI